MRGKGFRKRITAILLAAAMCVGQSAIVMADETDTQAAAAQEAESEAVDEETAEDSLASTADTEEAENTADTAEDSEETMDVSAEETVNDQSDDETVDTDVITDTVETVEADAEDASVSLADAASISLNVNDYGYDQIIVTVENYEKNESETLAGKVWGYTQGEDGPSITFDLKWDEEKSAYTGTIISPNESDSIHTFSQLLGAVNDTEFGISVTDGETKVADDIFFAAADFELSLENVDNGKGTLTAVADNFDLPFGAESVSLQVWNKADTSVKKTYTMTADKEKTSFSCNFSLADFSNACGTYVFSATAKDTSGLTVTKKTTQKFEITGTMAYAQSGTGSTYKLKTSGISVPGGCYSGTFSYSVWTKSNKSDLKEYTAKYYSGSKAASASFPVTDFKTYGNYKVILYVKNAQGDTVSVATKKFAVSKPSVDKLSISRNTSDGSFTLSTVNAKATAGMNKVQFAVWSKKDQSDLVWYDAKKSSAGVYTVSSNITKHNSNMGTYQVHCYITDNFGTKLCVSKSTFEMDPSAKIKVTTNGYERAFRVKVSSVKIPAGLSSIQVAVWSKTGGQDDLKWYTAKKSGSAYATTVWIKDYKGMGQYYCHVYAKLKNGNMVYLGKSTQIKVTSKAKATGKVIKRYEDSGKFTVKYKVTDSVSGTSKVQFQAYYKNKKSTAATYSTKSLGNGYYKATIAVSKHDYRLGDYVIRCYVTMGNGQKVLAGTMTYNFNPTNFLYIQKPENRKRTITLANPAADTTKVQFAVWTKTSGQDDLNWYTASKNSAGNYVYTLTSDDFKKFKHSGTAYVHCYANGTKIKTKTFTIAASELVKDGWYYEGNYWYYYKNDTKQTDLTSILGLTDTNGSNSTGNVNKLHITVNRKSGTVTVYAQDYVTNKSTSTGAYNVPVIAFKCSCGLDATPTPTGDYKIQEHSRWKTLMGPSYGQFTSLVKASSGIYFHSVAGSAMNSYNLESNNYNMLGYKASHGCIRLCVRDAHWIYCYCGLGTTIHIDDSCASPLERQYVPFLTPDQVNVKDPTDVWG